MMNVLGCYEIVGNTKSYGSIETRLGFGTAKRFRGFIKLNIKSSSKVL